MSTKVATTEQLVKLIKKAQRHRYNRHILTTGLDARGFHLLRSLAADDHVIRCSILLKLEDKEDPVEVELDVSYDDFNKLPRIETVQKMAAELQR